MKENNSSSWNIYFGHKPQTDNESPFETARKETITALEKIHDLGIKLSPYLHETVLDCNHAKYLKDIKQLSKRTWLYREKIIQMKPLADILLRYNTTFLEFYEKFFTLSEDKSSYLLSKETYDACIEFLAITNKLLVEIRSF